MDPWSGGRRSFGALSPHDLAGSERAFLVGTALRQARSARRSSARLRPEGQLDERISQPSLAESRAMTLDSSMAR